jgi:hypothetical protein
LSAGRELGIRALGGSLGVGSEILIMLLPWFMVRLEPVPGAQELKVKRIRDKSTFNVFCFHEGAKGHEPRLGG